MVVSHRHNGWHAEDDLDVIPVHFDPSDHHSNDVACPMPIEPIQSLVNFVGEILQTANNQCQILFGFGGLNQRVPVFLQTRKPLLHAHNARLELCPIDQSFRIAVDQSADTAAQTADLALKCRQGIDLARTSAGRAEAPPVLVGKPSRIFKHGPDLVPALTQVIGMNVDSTAVSRSAPGRRPARLQPGPDRGAVQAGAAGDRAL